MPTENLPAKGPPPKEIVAATQALPEWGQLRRFDGPPNLFWFHFLRSLAHLCQAQEALLLSRDQSAAADNAKWTNMMHWTINEKKVLLSKPFEEQLPVLADQCVEKGTLVQPLEGLSPRDARLFILGLQVQMARPEDQCVAVFLVSPDAAPQVRELLTRLRLVTDTPALYYFFKQSLNTRGDNERFSSILEVIGHVNAEKHFLAAVMALCNGLSNQLRCDRVSLGWQEHGHLRLQAVSGMEQFDRHLAAGRLLETAMEEAHEQDQDLVWPPPKNSPLIVRDHDQYARERNVQFVCSVPLRLEEQGLAVVTCERRSAPFGDDELRQVRVTCDQVIRRLDDLKYDDRWWGGRLAHRARARLSWWVGPEHTWSKVFALLGVLTVLALIVIRVNYRVDARFILHSDEVAYLTAPFDGFIHKVNVRQGDPVSQNQVLVELDQNSLKLEEASAQAELVRWSREVDKARAQKALAEMRIAQASADQARAHWEQVRYRLEQSVLRSPYDGSVIEGELRERVGAPVRQGEMLFKVARMEPLFIRAEVSEKDIHEVRDGAAGEIAFTSQPRWKFPMRVDHVEPVSQPKEKENLFLVRCLPTGKSQPWWRPGMTGIVKINAGKRSLMYILVHRTVDALRLMLWW